MNKTFSKDDIEAFETWLRDLLKTDIVTVTFTKKDGTTRVMRSTLRSDLIPSKPVSESKRIKSPTPGVIAVYDLECNDWRSFTVSSVSEVRFGIGEQNEQ
jgi:hypothetical protein